MSKLQLDIQAGRLMLINGATIQFQTRTRLLLRGHARFLFGKQVMGADDATTPARRMYFAVQDVYVGDPAGHRVPLRRFSHDADQAAGSFRMSSESDSKSRRRVLPR